MPALQRTVRNVASTYARPASGLSNPGLPAPAVDADGYSDGEDFDTRGIRSYGNLANVTDMAAPLAIAPMRPGTPLRCFPVGVAVPGSNDPAFIAAAIQAATNANPALRRQMDLVPEHQNMTGLQLAALFHPDGPHSYDVTGFDDNRPYTVQATEAREKAARKALSAGSSSSSSSSSAGTPARRVPSFMDLSPMSSPAPSPKKKKQKKSTVSSKALSGNKVSKALSGNKATAKVVGGRPTGVSNYSEADSLSVGMAVQEILPLGARGWDSVSAYYNRQYAVPGEFLPLICDTIPIPFNTITVICTTTTVICTTITVICNTITVICNTITVLSNTRWTHAARRHLAEEEVQEYGEQRHQDR
jgi:hypothetical protein